MRTTAAVIMSFIISVILCPIVIPFLKKLKFGQYIREEGPKSHQAKSGTPTMGGLVILGSIIITSLFFIKSNVQIIPILFVTIGFGLIGFLDDYIKVVMKRNLGLRAWQKMLGQFIVAVIFLIYILKYSDLGTETIIPFYGSITMPLWLYIIMFIFVMLGTVNGANFTDGLDGLATSVTVIIAVFFTSAAYIRGVQITPITGAVAGALLGFFLFNKHPAKVFMGDTGSLALGGFVASTAYMLKMPLFIIIVAFIYLIEVVSVIIQVTYFKLTHGKRIFKMAPIHHHFELCGFSETQVVAGFAVITAVLCLLAYLAL
ncbi:MAG: phospho-N-acetylmuramoyl-pentapeptide-transferase [Eubacterium sp.]